MFRSNAEKRVHHARTLVDTAVQHLRGTRWRGRERGRALAALHAAEAHLRVAARALAFDPRPPEPRIPFGAGVLCTFVALGAFLVLREPLAGAAFTGAAVALLTVAAARLEPPLDPIPPPPATVPDPPPGDHE